MPHHASPRFWRAYVALPPNVRERADRAFALLKEDPDRPSLHFKRVGRYHSVRIGFHHRALAVDVPDGLLWFWIGTYAEYDQLVR